MNKKLENVLAEKDIMGTQLVKKNDMVALQASKIKLLQSTLDRGEKQYEQRLDDIKLLRMEIKRLRTEKNLLVKGIENMIDLRLEVFNLERELNRERIRVRALEEMLETPQNIHRWRKLQGTDPETLDLLQKIQILQNKLTAKSQQLNASNTKVEKLRQVLAVQPDPEAETKLKKTKVILSNKTVKVKALTAEVSMREAQARELGLDVERLTMEVKDFKEKYYALKKDGSPDITEHQAQDKQKVPAGGIFLGGGFRLQSQGRGDHKTQLSPK